MGHDPEFGLGVLGLSFDVDFAAVPCVSMRDVTEWHTRMRALLAWHSPGRSPAHRHVILLPAAIPPPARAAPFQASQPGQDPFVWYS